MLFSGLTKCKLDSNGRIKLPPKVIDDLLKDGNGEREIVLYCMSEGCLALFSQRTWAVIRSKAETETPDLLNDEELRRRSRRIAANTQSQDISPQGRLTIPGMFRDKLGFKDGEDVIIAGNERGFEIWTETGWANEEKKE